jgi:hypothetical protein
VTKRPSNPKGNALGSGVTRSALLDAVVRSGFPLQTIIAARLLRRKYDLDEEWAYVDADTEEQRTLDIRAEGRLQDSMSESSKGRMLGTQLSLLIECKQSELPFVAFEAVSAAPEASFPILAGLPRRRIEIHVPGEARYRYVRILRWLSLDDHAFIRTPPVASSLSAASRSGSKLSLTGEMPYRSLILPLTKAVRHYRRYWKGIGGNPMPQTGGSWVGRLTVPVAVVDAPLVLARTPSERTAVTLVPWIRVIRRHADLVRDYDKEPDLSLVDVVHKDFFDEYEGKFLSPYARLFRKRLVEQQEVLMCGSVDVPSFKFDEPTPKDVYGLVKKEGVLREVVPAS